MVIPFRYLLFILLILLLPQHAWAAESVTQDFTHTVYLQPFGKLRKAAEQGDAQAQYDLAYLYYKSGIDPEVEGVGRSDRQAARWYRAAAMQGHPRAQYNMAVLHLQGHGVERDAITAYAWLMLASDNGHEESSALIAELNELLNTDQIEEARLRSAALKASDPLPEYVQDN